MPRAQNLGSSTWSPTASRIFRGCRQPDPRDRAATAGRRGYCGSPLVAGRHLFARRRAIPGRLTPWSGSRSSSTSSPTSNPGPRRRPDGDDDDHLRRDGPHGRFLPSRRLALVTAGVFAARAAEHLGLNGLLIAAAILGDTVGYWFGRRTGPALFTRPKSLLFNPDHLRRAHDFYEKHGGKTIILARFMPIIRTFAPIVAGMGKMEYRRFLSFNVFGGVSGSSR